MTLPTDNTDWLKLRSNIYLRDKGICWICNSFVQLCDYDLGHLVDRCMGGQDELDNLVVMHKRCNLSKPHHNTLEDCLKWKLTIGFPEYRRSLQQPITKPRRPLIIKPSTIEKLNRIKPLTITWIQGKARWLLPPREDGTYNQEDKFAVGFNVPVPGCTKTGDRFTSPYFTVEVIGDSPDTIFKDVTINLGSINVSFTKVDGSIQMMVKPDIKNTNWEGVNGYTSKLEIIDYYDWRQLLSDSGILA
jgi:hypothetical protein